MSFLRKRGKYYYIRFYDSTLKKYKEFATTKTNKVKAENILKEFRENYSKKSRPTKLKVDRNHYTIEEAFQKFIEFGRVQNDITGNTVETYKYMLRKLTGAIGNRNVQYIDAPDFHQFVKKMRTEQLAESTIENYTIRATAFFNYLQKENIIDRNPFEKIPAKYVPPIRPVAPIDRLRMLLYCRRRKDWNFYILINLTYYLALRITEVIQMKIEDFDFDNELVTIRNEKGRRIDEIVLLNDTKKFMSLAAPHLPEQGRIFYYSSRHSMKQKWRRIIKHIKKDYSPKGLREARGTDLANYGADPLFLKQYMRHRDFKTTEKHYIQVRKESAKKSLNEKLKNRRYQ